MTESKRDEPDQKSPFLKGLRRVGVVLTLPLVGAALLWWLPDTQAQTILMSLVVIGLGLAGWWYWRDEE